LIQNIKAERAGGLKINELTNDSIALGIGNWQSATDSNLCDV
jgi:hypothetical protein